MSSAIIEIMGVKFDPLTTTDAIDRIIAVASDRTSPAFMVVKPYVEFLDLANRDPKIVRLLNQSDICLADGVAIVWAAHYLYAGAHTWRRLLSTLIAIVAKPTKLANPIPERVAGVSITWPLLEQAASHSLKVFLIGSPRANTIEQTATTLRSRFRRIQIVGTMHGVITTSYESRLLHELKQTKPDLILVGLGFPRQEQLMLSIREQLSHGVLIGEGGSFDYQEFGGTIRRAPRLLRKIGLEWLWRLMLEPSRIKRQLSIPRFIWNVKRQADSNS